MQIRGKDCSQGVKMINIAVCDDIDSEREQIREMLLSLQNVEQKWDFEIMEYIGGESLIMDVEERRYSFDLIFMDIYMDGINGMDSARKLRNLGVEAPLVFLTASPDFALESYDVNASGYLLKPVEKDRLKKILERLLARPVRPRICIQSERKKKYLFLDEIVFAESENHSIKIHLSNGETVVSGEKLSSLEKQLDERFLRCHQSFLVNMSYIADINDDFILRDGRRIPIRIRQHRAAADAYYRFFVKYALDPRGGG